MEMFFAIGDGESQKKLFLQKNIRKLLRKNVPFAKNVSVLTLVDLPTCEIHYKYQIKENAYDFYIMGIFYF